jgi:hypothetical protein
MIPGAFGSETTKIGIADRIARRVIDRVAPTARRAALETAGGHAGAEGSNRTIFEVSSSTSSCASRSSSWNLFDGWIFYFKSR